MRNEIELPNAVNHGSFFLMLRCAAQEAAMAYAHQEQMHLDPLSANVVALSGHKWIVFFDAMSAGGDVRLVSVNVQEERGGHVCARVPYLNAWS
jgi:hypothetical protein